MIRNFRSLINNFSSISKSQSSVIQLFKQRKLYYQSNSLQLEKDDFFVKNHGKAVYCGYDPTSSSLHLGNLVSIIMLARLNSLGLKPIFLVGGATGLIGDPSGKNKQRQLLQTQTIHHNIACIEKQISTVFQNITKNMKSNSQKYSLNSNHVENLNKNTFQIVNNYDFYRNINFIQFLRNIGKNFRMGNLLAKQMVAKRLQSQQGISYAQFSYSLMQGYDFSQLYEHKNCILQIGGSDQWGNILNGTQLIKKKLSKQAFAVTMPLLLTKSGAKFGKSQGNALFLNQEKTSLKQIYQYLYNTADEDLQKYLSIFTFFSVQKIAETLKQHTLQKEKRKGQQILAQEVVNLLGTYKHFDKDFFTLSSEQLVSKGINYIVRLYNHKKSTEPQNYLKMSKQKISKMQQIADLFVQCGATGSKKDLRRQVQAGGVYINNKTISKQESQRMQANVFLQSLQKRTLYQKFIILRWGKKKYYFIELQ